MIFVSEDNLNSNNDNCEVYSYHTFVFPFYFGDNKEVFYTKKGFNFNKIKISEYFVSKQIGSSNISEQVNNYNIKSYFTKSARNLVGFGDKDSFVVKVYELDKERFGDCKYIIKVKDIKQNSLEEKNSDGERKNNKVEENKKENIKINTYELSIYNLKLKLYENGVGLAIYELENKDYKSLSDVNRINEYGRRIRAPFLSLEDNEDKNCKLSAFSIKLLLNEIKNEKLIEIESKIIEDNNSYDVEYIPDFIKKVFFKDDNINIISVDDDRMFVNCLIRDDDLSGFFIKNKEKTGTKSDKKNERYKTNKWDDFYFSDKEKIYSLAYIEEECTCQSDKMIDKIMKRTLYDRWIGWGTFDLITNHSFIRVTSKDGSLYNSVINPFLYQYIEISNIALLQRATIKRILDNINYRYITRLHNYYAKQNTKVLFSKLTFQEQGDEEYLIIRNELGIDRMKEECDAHLNIVYNHNNMKKQVIISVMNIILTIVVVVLTFITLYPALSKVIVMLYEIIKEYLYNIFQNALL